MNTPRNEPCAPMRERLAIRYARLNLRAQEPPPAPARELRIAGVPCGWSTQAACDALHTRPDIHIGADCLDLMAAPAGGPSIDAQLASIAEQLRSADCLRGWRNELLDVITPRGVLGRIERAATRPLGLRTRAVHLNAWTAAGEIWIARRALSKSTDPGMWDTLVGGLVGAGESLDDALLRECHEEAGLTPDQLRDRSPLRTILRMHRRLPEGYQVEDLLVSHCILPPDAVPANRDGEVSDITAATPETVIAMIDEGAFTLEAALVLVEDMMRASNDPAMSARLAGLTL